MKRLTNRNTGRITIAAGIVALIGTIALIEFMVAGNSGLLSDNMTIYTSLLSIPLMIALGKMANTHNGSLSSYGQVIGVLGAAINFIGGIINVNALSGNIEYYQSASWIYVGSGLIGIAILIFALQERKNPDRAKGFVWLSIVFGLAMTMNFIALAFRDELNAFMRFEISFAEVNLFLRLMMFTGSPIVILGQPIWLIWAGRLFVKDKLSIPE